MSAKQLAALKMRSRQTPTKFPLDGNIQSPQTEVPPQLSPSIPSIPVFCICNRQHQDILCRSCGHCFVGRVRRQCPVHPNAILLMDSPCCPHCKCSQLMEIRTSTTPVKEDRQEEGIEEELRIMRRRLSGTPPVQSPPVPESWETRETSWVHEPKTPPGSPPLSAGFRRISAGSSEERFAGSVGSAWKREEWDVENSSEPWFHSRSTESLQRGHIAQPTVQSTGSLGQRFAGIARGSHSVVERNDPWRHGVLTEVVKRQQLTSGWDDEKEKMSEMCFGDRRY